MRDLEYNDTITHDEYERMELNICLRDIRIEIKDGYEKHQNSHITISHDDFDRIEYAIKKYRESATNLELMEKTND
jgi:hypothetical protein